ncbi:phosphate ABC transporter substrate-binding protein PstS [bacterium]|nr:phosphate ABC transporter substrate-binding protein PstS [bacterium]
MSRITNTLILVAGIIVMSTQIMTAAANAKEDLSDVTINGAGASFPYPIYSKWAYKYHKLTGMKLNYQSIGSGGGIAQIKAKTVDFGASDKPLKSKELNKYGLLQFPMVMGGVVPVVNFYGINPGDIKLSNEMLAEIFLGEITMWNDDKIAQLNPDVNLPKLEITVVHRSDGSGTTWIFTNYLSKVSSNWKDKVGNAKKVSWPIGIGAKGNEGVANYVKRVEGSIGYVEYAYAMQNKLAYVVLKNQAGVFVEPNMDTFKSAAANAQWDKAQGYYLVLTNQPGDNSWPITGASFILLYKNQADEKKIQAMLKYFNWCYIYGADMAQKLDYVPMPENVVKMIDKTWSKDIKVNGKPVLPAE